jgi:predicted nucleic acid-binding protein
LPDLISDTSPIQYLHQLGLLLDAKTANLIEAVSPYLDQLDELNFHLAPKTRRLILQRAGETPDR